MRVFLLTLVIALSAVHVSAEVGCSTYNGLYPNSLNSINPSTGLPLYDNSDYIVFRTWDGDSNCGIRDNLIRNADPFGQCDVKDVANYGVLVEYNPEDNSCIIADTPLDNGVLMLVIAASALGVFALAKPKGERYRLSRRMFDLIQ